MNSEASLAGKFVALYLMTGSVALAVEPSPIQATGVIDEESGVDASNWDVAPFNAFTFTQTEKIFPTLIISPGTEPAAPLIRAAEQIDMATLTVTDLASGETISAERLLEDRIRNSGLILIHKGKVIHAREDETL